MFWGPVVMLTGKSMHAHVFLQKTSVDPKSPTFNKYGVQGKGALCRI